MRFRALPYERRLSQSGSKTNCCDRRLEYGKPVVVSIALHVINLADIDELSERFNLMFYLQAQWHDPRLAYNPRGPAEHFHVVHAETIWHPRLEFINELGSQPTGDASLRVSPDGNVLYIERTNGEFSARFRLRRFPFDRQALQLIIHPFIGQALAVILRADQSHKWISREESEYSSFAEWQMMGIKDSDSQASFSRFGPIRRSTLPDHGQAQVPLLHMEDIRATAADGKAVVERLLDRPERFGQPGADFRHYHPDRHRVAFSISLNLPKAPYLTFIDAFFLDCLLFVFFTAVEMTTVHVSGRTQREDLGLQIRRVSRVGGSGRVHLK